MLYPLSYEGGGCGSVAQSVRNGSKGPNCGHHDLLRPESVSQVLSRTHSLGIERRTMDTSEDDFVGQFRAALSDIATGPDLDRPLRREALASPVSEPEADGAVDPADTRGLRRDLAALSVRLTRLESLLDELVGSVRQQAENEGARAEALASQLALWRVETVQAVTEQVRALLEDQPAGISWSFGRRRS